MYINVGNEEVLDFESEEEYADTVMWREQMLEEMSDKEYEESLCVHGRPYDCPYCKEVLLTGDNW